MRRLILVFYCQEKVTRSYNEEIIHGILEEFQLLMNYKLLFK